MEARQQQSNNKKREESANPIFFMHPVVLKLNSVEGSLAVQQNVQTKWTLEFFYLICSLI